MQSKSRVHAVQTGVLGDILTVLAKKNPQLPNEEVAVIASLL